MESNQGGSLTLIQTFDTIHKTYSIPVNRVGFGYGYGDVRPVDAIRGLLPRPVLLMHGTDDLTVPFEQALCLVDEVGRENVEFVAFQRAGHCGGYFQDRPGYVKRVVRFLDQAIG